jgi:hypothetical protein
MTDEELAAIRERAEKGPGPIYATPANTQFIFQVQSDVAALLNENAAMREIVEQFVGSAVLRYYTAGGPRYSHEAWYECSLCERESSNLQVEEFPHTPDCPVTKARAILGKDAS